MDFVLLPDLKVSIPLCKWICICQGVMCVIFSKSET